MGCVLESIRAGMQDRGVQLNEANHCKKTGLLRQALEVLYLYSSVLRGVRFIQRLDGQIRSLCSLL